MLSVLPLLGASGCATKALLETARSPDTYEYKEVIDQVMMTEDGRKLVVIGPKFHYIFDVKPQFSKILRSPLQEKLTAGISDFFVREDASVSGNVVLTLKDANDEEFAQAESLGFTGSKTEARLRYDLRGKRYSASGFDMPAGLKQLNRSYEVSVVEWHKGLKQAMVLLTPLTVAADGVIVLAAIPLLSIWLLSAGSVRIM